MFDDEKQITSNEATTITKSLDDLVSYIRMCQNERELTNEEIQNFIIQIPLYIYAIINECELVGLKGDLAKLQKSVMYAKVFNEMSGTVESRKNTAIFSTQDEQKVSMICDSVYKIVEKRIEMAYELLNSLKKVMNMRIAELQLSNGKEKLND